ncbi:hypothetical protein BMJ29_30355 [Sinorhizobium medicae]|nr:hypothetical protein BMJ29_30355 [Sinorhizobium medicae]
MLTFALSIELILITVQIMTNWTPDTTLLRRPAYLSLADQFARAIQEGRLQNGARLPTHRKLADDLPSRKEGSRTVQGCRRTASLLTI